MKSPVAHRAGHHRTASHDDHHDADHPDDHAGKRRGRRHARHRLGDIAEQAVRALGEDQILAALGGVGLDDAHATQGLVQATGHFGRDLTAFAEQRPQHVEGVAERATKEREDEDGDQREMPIEIQQDAECADGGDDAPRELHEAGAHQVANALRIVHDARDEHAGLRFVEVAHRQAHDMFFDAAPHVGDRLLRGHAQNLRQPVGRERLRDRRAGRDPGQHRQQFRAVLAR